MNYFTRKLQALKDKGLSLKEDFKQSIRSLRPSIQLKPVANSFYYSAPNLQTSALQKHCQQVNLAPFRIWNFVQKAQQFQSQNVIGVDMHNYPMMPMITLLEYCASMRSFIQSRGTIIVRGTQSATLISVYLKLTGEFQFLGDALIFANSIAGIKKDQTTFPSQHSYFRNLMNLMGGLSLQQKSFILKKVTLKFVPQMLKTNQQGVVQKFRPYLQIRHLQFQTSTTDFKQTKEGIEINLSHAVVDDVMVVMKHQCTPYLRHMCFRLIFNTNFVDDKQLIVSRTEMDSSKDAFLPPGFQVKFEFDVGLEQSQLDPTWKKQEELFGQKTTKTCKLVQAQGVQQSQLLQPVSKTQQIDSPGPPQVKITLPQIQKIIETNDHYDSEDIDDYISNLQKSITN